MNLRVSASGGNSRFTPSDTIVLSAPFGVKRRLARKARVESLTLVSSLLPFDPRGFLLRVLSDEPGIPRSSPKRRYGTVAGVRFLRMAARERRSRYDTACDGVGHRRKVGRRISCECFQTSAIKKKTPSGHFSSVNENASAYFPKAVDFLTLL